MGCIGPVMKLGADHPLALGNLFQEPLSAILQRAEENVILHTIRVWGPHRVVALLKSYGAGRLLPGEYIENSTCDVCFKLFSNAEILGDLKELALDKDFRRKVAYGRLYYLNEDTMAKAIVSGLDG